MALRKNEPTRCKICIHSRILRKTNICNYKGKKKNLNVTDCKLHINPVNHK